MSDPDSPIRPIDSSVNLTCTADLGSAIDISVDVNFEWTGPDGFSRRYSQTLQGPSNATDIATVNSLGRDESGNYTCSVLLNSTSSFINNSNEESTSVRVTVGKLKLYLS